MAHLRTLHLVPVVDATTNHALTPQKFARLTPNEQSSVLSSFRSVYNMAGTTADDVPLMPFCKRGVTIAELEKMASDAKSNIAKATKRVLDDQNYFHKSYKELYKK